MKTSKEAAPNPRNDAVTSYWLAFYLTEEGGLCSLCGNFGLIYTEGIRSPIGALCGRTNFCICPNGQLMRAGIACAQEQA